MKIEQGIFPTENVKGGCEICHSSDGYMMGGKRCPACNPRVEKIENNEFSAPKKIIVTDKQTKKTPEDMKAFNERLHDWAENTKKFIDKSKGESLLQIR